MKISFFLLLIAISWNSFAQSTIALTNHVKYKNGDSYIDPSFKYAGTGFVLQSGDQTFAVTAKHVLWIARNKNSRSVQINNDLNRWTLRSRDEKDSVVVDQLINEDTNETLDGPVSTILERDWLVFSVKSMSSGIKTLKLRYSDVVVGEPVFIMGNPYSETKTLTVETKVVTKLGMDILLESVGGSLSGFSGSPIVDRNGLVIGIFSSASNYNGKDVFVATSTEYFRNVVERKEGLNISKKDYGELIFQTVLKTGTRKAIEQYKELAANTDNYYNYNLRSANRNGLLETGDKLIEMKRYKDAIDILEFNVSVNSSYFHNYNRLASAHVMMGNKEEAIKYYRISTVKFNSPEENEAFKELEKLGAVRGERR